MRGPTAPSWLSGGGEMGSLIRSMDWSGTPLGPFEAWPQSLRTSISTCLNSRFPILVWWGPEMVKLYNDAYRPMLGDKHPRSMGQPGHECWGEIWDIIGPMLQGVLERGEATWSENQMLPLHRSGYTEECYFTFSYSPIRDESGGVGGVFCAVTEVTEQVLGQRRLATLRALAERNAGAETVSAACARTAGVLAEAADDVPFSLIYLLDREGKTLRLAGGAGLAVEDPARAERIEIDAPEAPWQVAAVMKRGKTVVIPDVDLHGGGPWPEAIHTAVALPIVAAGARLGVLVVGVSPRRILDECYRSFFEVLADHIGKGVASAKAYEEERRRAEALAEIDRAKTAFFSNVSHEFRTPLTLLLGPLEDALRERGGRPAAEVEQLELMHRNALRLAKLVNTLLDFSRIEAGRIQASYQPVDLAALTKEIASAFEPTIARAGLRFQVDAEPLPLPIHVDVDMWEKIVLNLLSNAFKFTLDGEIRVSLAWRGDRAVLAVRDTGTGIPSEELPRIFERFHRIPNARARTHEGTGIGLAFVHDLVRLHGGKIEVDSNLDEGSTFRVSIPAGVAHLPAERIGARKTQEQSVTGAAPFVEEAGRWQAEDAVAGPDARVAAGRILVADDNADMRSYLERVLCPQYDVETAPDGQAALEAARARSFDLVVTDMMMPRLDGFQLLHALRAGEQTARIPVIMLSARAGDEARAEGIEAGADDYIVKPFSARELLARVGTHLKLRSLGAFTEELLARERAARADADAASRAKDEFLAMLSHELRNPLAPIVTSLQLLKLRGDEASQREQTIIERQVRHLVHLVDDLLDVSRITRGNILLKREEVRLAGVVAKAVETVSPLFDDRHHRLSVSIPKQGMRLAADEARLVQVFTNLLTNAAKYSEPYGEISLVAGRDGHEIVVQVKDLGIGIGPELLPRIFDLFTQGARGLDRAEGGLGLGLAIVRSLVHLHGGTVVALSDGHGHGSEFVVRLPALDAMEVDRSPSPQGPEAVRWRRARVPRRVLVVDDNRDAADGLAEVLLCAGHDVRIAYDGPEALQAAADFSPEVAILDIGLPVMDGYELADRLRSRWPHVRMIAVTGYGQEHDRRRGDQAGFALRLVKPVDVTTLVGAIEETAAQVGLAR